MCLSRGVLLVVTGTVPEHESPDVHETTDTGTGGQDGERASCRHAAVVRARPSASPALTP
jgi:hypothetical protein